MGDPTALIEHNQQAARTREQQTRMEAQRLNRHMSGEERRQIQYIHREIDRGAARTESTGHLVERREQILSRARRKAAGRL